MRKALVFITVVALVILSFTIYEGMETRKTNNKALEKVTAEYKELKDLPKEYDYKLAEINGDVVSVHGKGYNSEKLDAFIGKYNKQAPSMIRVTQYTIEGDAIIKDLIYDGKQLLIKEDDTRDKFAGTIARKIINYKATDIIVSKRDEGTQYDARLENGDIMPIVWISSK